MAQGPTVREAALELFRAHGMTTIFGNPGSTELPMLADSPTTSGTCSGCRRPSVVGMADGYAQASGASTLVNLHTAPGVGNAMGAIFNAQANKAPLVVTAGQQVAPQMTLQANLTNRDADEVPQPVVKWSYEPPRPRTCPAALARAIHVASLPPPGPVFVSIPMDDWDAERRRGRRGAGHVGAAGSRRRGPDPAGLDVLAERLGGASRPGARRRRRHRRGAAAGTTPWRSPSGSAPPVWASPAPASGRLGFPEDHPQFRARCRPRSARWRRRSRATTSCWSSARRCSATTPTSPARSCPRARRLLHITADPDEAARAPMGDAVVADSALTLRALVERVGPGPADRAAPPTRRGARGAAPRR